MNPQFNWVNKYRRIRNHPLNYLLIRQKRKKGKIKIMLEANIFLINQFFGKREQQMYIKKKRLFNQLILSQTEQKCNFNQI